MNGVHLPERDLEGIVWYPLSFHSIDSNDIFDLNNPRFINSKKAFYVHVPFCKTICSYCPFNKYPHGLEKEKLFLDAISREVEMLASIPYVSESTFAAGYFGGGTPTSLSTGSLRKLLSKCLERFAVLNAEITVEANPDTVDEEKLSMLLDCGVNRISFGVQSFQDRFLKILGRRHRARQSTEAVKLARRLGFENIAIDLIYRIPTQSLDDWRRELTMASELGVDHISTYSLNIEKNTKLYSNQANGRQSEQPGAKLDADMFSTAVQLLRSHGYILYSIYDFSLPGKESLHHKINWQAPQGEYVGAGPGAFSFVRTANGSFVYGNHNRLNDYAASVSAERLPIDFGKRLTISEEMSRYAVLGSNCHVLPKDQFHSEFGESFDEVFGSRIQQISESGFLNNGPEEVSLTPLGKLYVANVSKGFILGETSPTMHPSGVTLQSEGFDAWQV